MSGGEDDLLLVGEVGKPHGISGEVYVVPISDDPGRFEPGAQLLHADGRVLTVTAARPHRDRFLVKFEDADSREEAEGLRGPLYVSSEDVRELDEDEYWEHDLVGCVVVEPDGAEVGPVTDVIHGAQDLLEVETAHGPRLIPAVKEIVKSVDVAARRIEADIPEGLLD